MSRRIAERFARARAEKRKALVIYLTADDPDFDTSKRLMIAAAGAGADIIEVGVPWSDPSATARRSGRHAPRSAAGAGPALAGYLPRAAHPAGREDRAVRVREPRSW